MDKNEEDSGPSARKKCRSSGSKTLAYLNEKIEKENKVTRTTARTEKKKELELQERHLKITQDQQNHLLTNIMTQNNHF